VLVGAGWQVEVSFPQDALSLGTPQIQSVRDIGSIIAGGAADVELRVDNDPLTPIKIVLHFADCGKCS
jgi:hypothetical protein